MGETDFLQCAQIWTFRLGHFTRSLLWIIPSASWCVKLKTNLYWSSSWSGECFSSGLFFDSQSALSGPDWSYKEECPHSGPFKQSCSSEGRLCLPVVVTHTTTHGSPRSRWKMILTQWQRKLGWSSAFTFAFLASSFALLCKALECCHPHSAHACSPYLGSI